MNVSASAPVSMSEIVGNGAPRSGNGDEVLDLLLQCCGAGQSIPTARLGMPHWHLQQQAWLALSNLAQDVLDPN